MQRRHFLTGAGAAIGLSVLPLGGPGLIRGWAASAADRPVAGQRLIAIFLRGGADGLSMVAPVAERNYYESRPTIAIPPPNSGDGAALALDRQFGLHPGMAALLPLWRQGSLAIVHACALSDPTRSHFDAQMFVENGTPGQKATQSGWMNRLLQQLPGAHAATQAVSFQPSMPLILEGPLPVANMPIGGKGDGMQALPIDRPQVAAAFDQLYGGTDAMSAMYRTGRVARDAVRADLADEPAAPTVELAHEMVAANNGAPPAAGFPRAAGQIARLIARDPATQLVFLSLGGWDSHIGQGQGGKYLTNHMAPLADGLAALASGLGDQYRDTVILVFSEFGRALHQNGAFGSDHGHGDVMFALGGGVRGGRFYGDWPGLDAGALKDGRELAMTTDLRAVFATVIARHLRMDDRALAAIFPQPPAAARGLGGLIA